MNKTAKQLFYAFLALVGTTVVIPQADAKGWPIGHHRCQNCCIHKGHPHVKCHCAKCCRKGRLGYCYRHCCHPGISCCTCLAARDANKVLADLAALKKEEKKVKKFYKKKLAATSLFEKSKIKKEQKEELKRLEKKAMKLYKENKKFFKDPKWLNTYASDARESIEDLIEQRKAYKKANH